MLGTKTKATAALKIMVFKVENLFLGIELESVQKVLAMPIIHKGGNSFLGVTQVEDQQIVVLDLYHTIYGVSGQQGKGYFIIVKAGDKRYGLTTATLPTMAQIPLTDFCLVPAEYRDRDTLGIADRMAQVVLDKNTVSTVFLLDPMRLTALVQQFDQSAMEREYQTLTSVRFPTEVLDLPMPPSADPVAGDFQLDWV
jgi:chemotaxis signal transduction protein